MKAIWNGRIIAESDRTLKLEGNYYFPQSSINKEFISQSDTLTLCPWKGEAHYFNIEVGGRSNRDAAWYYPSPSDAAKEITNYVAFWRGVEITN